MTVGAPATRVTMSSAAIASAQASSCDKARPAMPATAKSPALIAAPKRSRLSSIRRLSIGCNTWPLRSRIACAAESRRTAASCRSTGTMGSSDGEVSRSGATGTWVKGVATAAAINDRASAIGPHCSVARQTARLSRQ